VQPGRLTVQGVLEEALAAALGENVRVTPAGRTDTGVHASGQVVSFATDGLLDGVALVRATNARLPSDILALRAAEMPAGFDARRDALRRHYRYVIWNAPLPNLWARHLSWHVPVRLDLAAMQGAAARLVGRHDFAAFAGQAAREPLGRSTTRTVERASWSRRGAALMFQITADAFLRHMVRAIVGTSLEVGRGRTSPDDVGAILDAADRRRAGPNAPPTGLMLVRVDYPERFRSMPDEANVVGEAAPDGPSTTRSVLDPLSFEIGVSNEDLYGYNDPHLSS
jgi:tRNA pseudouridine38-40 synthase